MQLVNESRLAAPGAARRLAPGPVPVPAGPPRPAGNAGRDLSGSVGSPRRGSAPRPAASGRRGPRGGLLLLLAVLALLAAPGGEAFAADPRPAAAAIPSSAPSPGGASESDSDLASEPDIRPAAASSTASAGLEHFRPERREDQRRYEEALRSAVDPARLRAWHDLLSSRPHVAGSAGDLEVIANLASSLREMGLEVEVQELWLWLPRPVEAELAVVRPERVELDLQEDALPEDPYSDHPELQPGWNAYSGSGTVEAGIVFANHGTREDFERLAELGVEVAGKIAVVRYGRNFRGYKAKFAEAAGAAGLVLYLDPEDYGYVRGLMWPEGGWANGSTIQRGSLLTLDYPGDPLTPFVAADDPPGPEGGLPRGEGRLEPGEVAFHSIPVQPVGWAEAAKILSRMEGPAVPAEWQGGLPFNYRLTGGDGLRVRLRVQQESALVRTANVVARLPGERYPDELVVVGCHHDAWSFGAGDPNAGSILVLEAARAFAEAARQGRRPDRTLVFAHWAAEEQGIQGSVEWVEAHAEELAAGAVAYVNLDMAAMGTRFGAGATPSLAPLVRAATREVESPVADAGSVYDEWSGRGGDGEPELRALGGGSDHVGFSGHLGIPAASLGGGGSPGISYHTNYEDLAWYRAVVGDDYLPARMLTQVVVTALARLAEADVPPLAPAAYGAAAAVRARELAAELAEGADGVERLSALAEDLEAWAARMEATENRLRAVLEAPTGAPTAANPRLAPRIGARLRGLDRAWTVPEGLSGRPWYRNLYDAPDADSGYAAWVLPELTAAVESGEGVAVERAVAVYRGILDRLETRRAEIESLLDGEGAPDRSSQPEAAGGKGSGNGGGSGAEDGAGNGAGGSAGGGAGPGAAAGEAGEVRDAGEGGEAGLDGAP